MPGARTGTLVSVERPARRRRGEGGLGRQGRRRARRRGHGVGGLGARGRGARHPLRRRPGRQRRRRRGASRISFAVHGLETAASGARRWRCARSRSRPSIPRAAGACGAASRDCARAPRRLRRALPRPRVALMADLGGPPREDQPHVRAVDPGPARADAARGDDRVPALPDRRHLRGRGALAARGPHRRASPTSTACCATTRATRPSGSRADWVERGVAHHAGYQELMAEVPFVLDAFFALSPGAIAPDPRRTSSARPTAWPSIVARTRDGSAHAALDPGAQGLLLHRRRHRRRDALGALPARPAGPRRRSPRTCASAPRPSARRCSSSTS